MKWVYTKSRVIGLVSYQPNLIQMEAKVWRSGIRKNSESLKYIQIPFVSHFGLKQHSTLWLLPGFLQVGVGLRICWGYSAVTALCGSSYLFSYCVPSHLLHIVVATVVLCYMRHTQQNSHSISHLVGTVTTRWLESDGVVTIANYQQHGDLSCQWQSHHCAAGS